MITSRQLQAFVTLIEKGSFTRAAEAMGITQPTMSKLIHTFEREVGMSLFVPDRQRMVPTPEAVLLAERALRTVNDLRALQEMAHELRHLETGRLELIAVSALGNHVLVDLLAQMTREIPDLGVSLSVSVERDVVGWLVSSQADWGLCLNPVDRPDVVCVPILHFAACCVMPATHRLARKAVVRPEDLHDERFISFRRDGRLRQIIDGLFIERDIRRRLNLEVYGSEQACAMVSRDMGVALVDPLSAHKYVMLGQVVERPFEPSIPYTVYLLRNRYRPVSQVGLRFAELLRKRMPRLMSDMKVRLLKG
ncbi:MAG: LysR family transcriptional regulator [Betaproteobacteria bacterium]